MPPSQSPGRAASAVDPDIDLGVAGQRREWSAHRWVLPVIAAGGMAGSSARYALELAWPAPGDGFPWSTFATNVSGCLLIGVLMVNVVEAGQKHPLVRPFLGVGLLGGYTTFSTYTVQTHGLVDAGRPATALVYVLGTALAALVAATAGVILARTWLRARHRLSRRRKGS